MRRSHQLNRVLFGLTVAAGLTAGVVAASALGAPVGALLGNGSAAQDTAAEQCKAAKAQTSTRAGGSATVCWITPGGEPFTLRDAQNPPRPALYPGGTTPLNVEVTNPSVLPLRVRSIDVAVEPSKSRCSAKSVTTHASRFTGIVEIPPRSTRSLADFVPPAEWPALQMLNTGGNQDACKNTKFSLTYSATGSRP